MNEEENKTNENDNQSTFQKEHDDFMKAIIQAKKDNENFVPREIYEQTRKNLKEVSQMLLNGEKPANDDDDEPKIDKAKRIQELRNELYSGKSDDIMSNRNYIAKTMELRNLLMESGEPDPFVPQNDRIQYDENAAIKAQRVADGFQYCLDNSNTDEEFVAKLNSITREPSKFYR